jgi:hypothetical protein
MKNIILITIPNRMVDSELIEDIQSKIVSYFGTKNAVASPEYPTVDVDCEIVEADINKLTENLNDKIRITAVIGSDNSERVSENFIHLD